MNSIGFVSLNPLPTGANFIGFATTVIGNQPTVTVGNLISLASGQTVGLNPGSNFIGLATTVIGNQPTVNVGNLLSLASGQFVGLNPGANYIGLATVIQGAALPAGTNFVGLASIQGNVDIRSQKDTFAAAVTFTHTLASLANSTAGVGRQSNLITSNTAKSALIAVKFTVGTSPTANTLIYVYLIRGDGTLNDDNAGSSDAGITIINAPLLGTILCSAVTSNATYYGLFDTKFLGSLGPSFGIAIVNSTGATANATGGNFSTEYTLIT